jgi:ribonuclease P protein component
MMPGCFQRDQRIRREQDFDALFKRGRKIRGHLLNLWLLKRQGSQTDKPAIAIMVSRKTAPSSVVRNCWKRKIKEAFRQNQEKIQKGRLLLIQVRSSEKVPPMKIIEAELLKLIESAEQYQ